MRRADSSSLHPIPCRKSFDLERSADADTDTSTETDAQEGMSLDAHQDRERSERGPRDDLASQILARRRLEPVEVAPRPPRTPCAVLKVCAVLAFW